MDSNIRNKIKGIERKTAKRQDQLFFVENQARIAALEEKHQKRL